MKHPVVDINLHETKNEFWDDYNEEHLIEMAHFGNFLDKLHEDMNNYIENVSEQKEELKEKLTEEIQTQEKQKNITTRNYENEFICRTDYCKKAFSSQNLLDEHVISHTKSKIFKCTEKNCGKVYKSKENLKLHVMNIHFKKKPYLCDYCSSAFSHRNGKVYHERKFHTHILPYVCTVSGCSMSFVSKSALKYHLCNSSFHSETMKRRMTKKNKSVVIRQEITNMFQE